MDKGFAALRDKLISTGSMPILGLLEVYHCLLLHTHTNTDKYKKTHAYTWRNAHTQECARTHTNVIQEMYLKTETRF